MKVGEDINKFTNTQYYFGTSQLSQQQDKEKIFNRPEMSSQDTFYDKPEARSLEAKTFSVFNGVKFDSSEDRDCECTERNLGVLET